MSDRNKTLLEKAAILTSSGGQLTPQQAEKFINTVIAQNDFLQKIKVQPMSASIYYIDAIEIAARQMRKATEGQAPGDTASVSFPRRTLETTEVILPYDIGLSFLEENISKKQAEEELNQRFGTAFGNDLLDLACNGDSSSDDSFLNIDDGWVTLALNDSGTNKVNINGVTDPKAIFKSMLQAMPAKWKRNKAQMVFMVDPDMEEEYRSTLGERATAMGDAYLTENRRAYYQGIVVEPVPYIANRNPVLTVYPNLWMGIGRNMRQDRQLQARKRIIEYTITAKVDFNYAISELIVVAHD